MTAALRAGVHILIAVIATGVLCACAASTAPAAPTVPIPTPVVFSTVVPAVVHDTVRPDVQVVVLESVPLTTAG